MKLISSRKVAICLEPSGEVRRLRPEETQPCIWKLYSGGAGVRPLASRPGTRPHTLRVRQHSRRDASFVWSQPLCQPVVGVGRGGEQRWNCLLRVSVGRGGRRFCRLHLRKRASSDSRRPVHVSLPFSKERDKVEMPFIRRVCVRVFTSAQCHAVAIRRWQ